MFVLLDHDQEVDIPDCYYSVRLSVSTGVHPSSWSLSTANCHRGSVSNAGREGLSLEALSHSRHSALCLGAQKRGACPHLLRWRYK